MPCGVDMSRPLDGRCALITGSTQGLGRAIAEHLAAEGCDIVLNGLGKPDEIEILRAGLARRFGVRVLHHAADLRDPAAIAAMMESAAAFGAVDILVNNAVVRHVAPVDVFEAVHWDEALAVNLSAAFHTIRLAVPEMRARNFGRIFNIASGYAFFGAADRVAYITTKTALLGLTRAVALD
ncbi:MAG: SDR family NAD(P)-dependent oxidoreductase, partial [Geminicoccales bacterium]